VSTTRRRPMRSAMLDTREISWVALLLFCLPVALFLVGKWCWIQCRITVGCWRLGMTRAEVRSFREE
jgi:hypothetical protein